MPPRTLSILVLTLALFGCASPRTLSEPNLYERLGSLPAIETVVDHFVANIEADARIRGFFARANRPKMKRWLAEFFCVSTGGPCQYTGRDMKTVHLDMGLNDTHFNALVEDLVKALDKSGVSAREKDDLLALLAPMRGVIVTR
ncbi:MAG: group 1 truncated hemoglobin [Betaproteobacteria bacterium]|nr:group 1 truncated hemoglobin [Betaproteobacteria bacterium]